MASNRAFNSFTNSSSASAKGKHSNNWIALTIGCRLASKTFLPRRPYRDAVRLRQSRAWTINSNDGWRPPLNLDSSSEFNHSALKIRSASLVLTAIFSIRLRLLVTENRNKPRWCFRHEPISSTKISKTLRRTVIDRIHKLGPSKSVEMIGESPAQTKGIGIDTYAETAPGPFQSCCQSCWRSHKSGSSIAYCCLESRENHSSHQPTGPGPEGCDENGPAAALLVGHVTVQICSLHPPVRLGPPCRRSILIATKYLVCRGQDTRLSDLVHCVVAFSH